MDAGATAGAVDLARWWSARRRPSLGVPVVGAPPAGPAAGWGVRVALLGGAVDARHPDLVTAVVEHWPGVRGLGPAPVDPRATAAATALVGQGTCQLRGLVPSATLLVAPVLGTGGGEDELVARAVRWAVHEAADVVVLPFGRRRLGRRVASTLRWATGVGTTVLASAGDLGPATLAFPGSTTGVLAVTAHDDDGVLAGCSTVADLAAPGHDVPAGGRSGVVRVGGAGVATVLAAGAWAAERSGAALRLLAGADVEGEARQRRRLVDA